MSDAAGDHAAATIKPTKSVRCGSSWARGAAAARIGGPDAGRTRTDPAPSPPPCGRRGRNHGARGHRRRRLLLPGDPPTGRRSHRPRPRPHRLPHAELDGLALRLPPGWHGTATRKDRMWGKAGPVAYLTSQDLPQPFATCPADVSGLRRTGRPAAAACWRPCPSTAVSRSTRRSVRPPGSTPGCSAPAAARSAPKRELYGLFAVGGATDAHPATAWSRSARTARHGRAAPLENALRQALATARITPSEKNG